MSSAFTVMDSLRFKLQGRCLVRRLCAPCAMVRMREHPPQGRTSLPSHPKWRLQGKELLRTHRIKIHLLPSIHASFLPNLDFETVAGREPKAVFFHRVERRRCLALDRESNPRFYRLARAVSYLSGWSPCLFHFCQDLF